MRTTTNRLGETLYVSVLPLESLGSLQLEYMNLRRLVTLVMAFYLIDHVEGMAATTAEINTSLITVQNALDIHISQLNKASVFSNDFNLYIAYMEEVNALYDSYRHSVRIQMDAIAAGDHDTVLYQNDINIGIADRIEALILPMRDFSIAYARMSNELSVQEAEQRSLLLVVISAFMVVFGIIIFFIISRSVIHAKQREEEAAAESMAKTRFLARMSHEIRTPMNSIMGITELQLQKDIHPPETEEALLRILNSSNLLLAIINDILDLSKVEAGKMEIIPDVYETASMIADTIQLNIMSIGSKQIDFKIKVDEKLPAFLVGDQIRIKQILNNILSNAFKYTDEGIVSMSIAVDETVADDVKIIATITDTGQGMTQEQVDSLFWDEFTRFNRQSNQNIQGSGLGLTIVYQLTHMMGGNISVESETGAGSTFIVSLPQRKKGSQMLGADAASRLESFESAQNLNKRLSEFDIEPMPYGRVLVVDDVEANLYVAKGFLMPYKIMVDTVESGALAVSKIKAGEVYDIIFMDHMMPEMDGIEATKIIRSMGYYHPIVALTANALSDSAQMFMDNGFSGYASKPIEFNQFKKHLIKFIRDKYSE
jgi:signal transduction histidine kinase